MTYQSMPEEQRQKKKILEETQPQAQGWAISGDPLDQPLPSAMPQPLEAAAIKVSEAQQLDYRAPSAQNPVAAAPAPWFGYIGLGIAIVALLLGLAGMVIGVIWFVGWLSA